MRGKELYGILNKHFEYGLMVKRLRRRPLTAETGVRFPMGLPKKDKLACQVCLFFSKRLSLIGKVADFGGGYNR